MNMNDSSNNGKHIEKMGGAPRFISDVAHDCPVGAKADAPAAESSIHETGAVDDSPFADAPVIFSYSRKQAIEDGVLVDLTEWAKETGFRIPVACTAEVWNRCITPPAGTRELGQSERGRCHDLLWMLYLAIRRQTSRGPIATEARGNDGNSRQGSDRLLYETIFLQAPQRHEMVQLKSICGPGDEGEPVLTIMMHDED